jgi:hypothetical protein
MQLSGDILRYQSTHPLTSYHAALRRPTHLFQRIHPVVQAIRPLVNMNADVPAQRCEEETRLLVVMFPLAI